jgi:hypothetical protein
MFDAEAIIVKCGILAMLTLSVVRLVMLDFNSLMTDLKRRRRHR